MVPDLLRLPPGTDLHKHPLVVSGSIFMQVSNGSGVLMVFLILYEYCAKFLRDKYLTWFSI